MRRRLAIPAVLTTLVALLGAARAEGGRPAPGARTWARAEIKLVTSRGLLGGDATAFRADESLTRAELADLAAGLTATTSEAVVQPTGTVTIAGLDSRLVRALDLAGAAATLQRAARAGGLAPPGRFGTEVVARLLGLRTNHPAGEDALEPLPTGAATRAEAAYSAARIIRLHTSALESVRAAAETYAPEPLEPWQRRVLTTAFSFVGYPYVWGGESERPETGVGPQAQGGFDCSGFVWRVFKLHANPGGAALATTLRGRTTQELSGELPRDERIPFADLAPGDVLFFGAKGVRSRPAQIDHAGIHAGGGWMIHSSGHGVTLVPLDGWYREHFAWGRRPLAEAGLAASAAG